MCSNVLYCVVSLSIFPYTVYTAARSVSSFVSNFEKAVADLPHREAVRYTDKNIKWTASNVNVRIYIRNLFI